MRVLSFIFFIGIILYSCDKEELRMFEMSGYYNVEKIRQLTYVNGNLNQEEEDNDVGTILFKKADTKVESTFKYEISTTIDLKAWDEIDEPGSLRWDASVNDKIVDIILEPNNAFSRNKSLTFTIVNQKNSTKELLYTNITQDSSQNLVVIHEFYELQLKD